MPQIIIRDDWRREVLCGGGALTGQLSSQGVEFTAVA